MDPDRKHWNQQQKLLRQTLTRTDEHQKGIALFLDQHAMVHSAEIWPSESQGTLYSFADEVWQDMPEVALRYIPPKFNHTVAWIIWHMARIEDVTMNILIADGPQLLHQADWQARLQIADPTTGNGMTNEAVAQLSAAINVEALWAYRNAVGLRTREIVQQLAPGSFKEKIDPERIQRIKDEGAVIAAASHITDYWSRRTIAGLLLMPPTRHNFVHLNEARRVKDKALKM